MTDEQIKAFIDKFYKENKHPALYSIRKNMGWNEDQVVEIIQALLKTIHS